MTIKINTSYGERLTSGMLNEKIHNITGGNEKLNGFNVALKTSTSVTITPGKALINGCAIEETSDTQTLTVDSDLLSTDGIVYVVINYAHEAKRVLFTCSRELTSTMAKLATLSIKNGAIAEVNNHVSAKTLNSIVGEAAEIEAQKIRDAIPSGFVEIGELDYDYMLNNENVVKLKNKSVAYVNGYRVEIPADTIINIGKAPEKDAREDLLFLEAWKDTDFLKDGKLKWRVRHVAGVDFESPRLIDGFNALSTIEESNILPQAGNESPISDSYDTRYLLFGNNRFIGTTRGNTVPNLSVFSDEGLAVSGMGSGTIKALKTLDGYSYAIPMFRLYRKPSCGKSIPFEYQKINPKVDYAKFAELMKEDKVERVVSETIGGRSLYNHLDFTKLPTTYSYDKTNNILITPSIDDTQWVSVIKSITNLRSNTSYSCIIKVIDTPLSFQIRESGGTYDIAAASNISTPGSTKIFTFTTSTATDLCFKAFDSSRSSSKRLQIMVLEGDWTNKEIPEYFTGLKSLGEDEGNLIEVKTGILNESSYDPDTGNAKLKTMPGTNNFILNNHIHPNIEAQLKRGNVKLSDINDCIRLDDLLGDEIVEVTKIKGKTLQNLATFLTKTINIGYDTTTGAYELPYTSPNLGGVCYKNSLLKPNTVYTYSINIIQNDINGTEPNSLKIQFGSGSIYASISKGSTGLFTGTITTGNAIDSDFGVLVRSSGATSGSVIFKNFKVVEGDFRDSLASQPFVEGMRSVGEDSNNQICFKRTGKNLLPNFIKGNWIHHNGMKTGMDENSVTLKGQPSMMSIKLHVKPYSNYMFSGYIESSVNHRVYYRLSSGSSDVWYVVRGARFNKLINTENSTEIEIGLRGELNTECIFKNLQLEEGEILSVFEPYTQYEQVITLKEPLRSLPNGVCDTIEGNKVIRRVGKLLLNGTETWHDNGNNANRDYYMAYYRGNFVSTSFYCDTLPAKHVNIIADETTNIIGTSPYKNLYVNLKKTLLTTADTQGVKTWFSQNPTTVYYELATPVEEKIEPNYDKESVKTYQLDAPLISLPDGTKDEIVNNKLIKRCGQFTLNGSEDNFSIHGDGGAIGDYIRFRFPLPLNADTSGTGSVIKNYCIGLNDTFKYVVDTPGSDYKSYEEAIYSGAAINSVSIGYCSILKSRLVSANENGFKSWLKANPIKIIYKLATPIEIPLKEAHASTANFSLQRQFSDGNWLRELPNGVKDTVENGKVIRRVGKYTFTGSENWWVGGVTGGVFVETNLAGVKANSDVLVNTLPSSKSIGANSSNNPVGLMITATPSIRIKYSSSDSTIDGFKTWLAQNPTTIYYELATPIEEALSIDNYMYYPHHEINTYCGSLYVGNGTNDVFVENGLKNDGVVIDTPFRSIENKAVVDDCRYKKSVDGYDTKYITSSTKNLVPYFTEFYLSYPEVQSLNGLTISDRKITGTPTSTFQFVYPVYLKANVTYYCKCIISGSNARVRVLNYPSTNIYITNIPNNTFRVPTSGYYYIDVENNYQIGSALTIEDLIISEEKYLDSYEPFSLTTKHFENTESNDVDDLRHKVSLTGFNYDQILNENFDKLLRGEL